MPESAAALIHPRLVLGVERSALGRAWHDACHGVEAQALAIAQTHGLPDMLARVLAARGVGIQDTPGFLAPKLRDLMPDPSTLRDMDAAAARLARAVRAGETVAIFGDYDVDGACSAALLAGYLRRAGTPFIIHIPDRIIEGYGPNVAAIRALKEAGATLLVTVDCGTASHEPLAEAARLGLDTIVLDHHQAPDELPPAVAVVNPNRQDDLSGLGHLAAAGVVFLALVALNRALRADGFWAARGAEPNLLDELDLVALATVADVVRLEGLNRAFVRQGLLVMRRRARLGLAALLDKSRLDGPPAAWHLGFMVGPRINAGGRIGDAALGAKLMLIEDPLEADGIAGELDRLNTERQAIEQVAVEEALAQAMLALEGAPDAPVIVAGSPDWHPGIVGLVAARLKERFRRPAFAFALDGEGGGTGSGRSVAGIDLGRAVRAAVAAGIAIKGGGHAMAAGVTLPPGGREAFAAFMNAEIAAQGMPGGADALVVDAVMGAGALTPELVVRLDEAGPFGQGHPEPIVALANHHLMDAAEVGSQHVRVRLKGGDGAIVSGIAFRSIGQPLGDALLASRNKRVHAAGTLSINRWGGSERVDLRLVDLALAER